MNDHLWEKLLMYSILPEGFHDFLARIQVHGHNHLQERLRNTIQIEIEVLGLER